MARRTRALTVFAALFALVLALWAPAAMAHHKDDHSKGGGNGSEETVTEDNDNDGLDNEGRDADGNGSYPNESQHPSGKDKYVEPGGSGNQGNSDSDPDDDGRGPERCEPVSSRTSGDGTCGPDKPGGTGGEDIFDQDGNNGCGNDQDFDDDNEGWCGKPEDQVRDSSEDKKPTDVCDADETMPGIQKCEKVRDNDVEGEVIVDRPCPENPIMGVLFPGLCDKGPGNDVEAGGEERPAGPVDEVEEEQNAVLGIRVTAAPEVAAAPAVAAAAVTAAPEVEGAVLPFTGASDLVVFVAIALMLIGTGALALRGRRTSA